MIKAIIADDEPAVGKIIRHFIEEYNMHINILATAKTGSEALDKISIYSPQLVFIDIEMPKMTGLEVIESTQQSGNCKSRFIIITGYDLFEYAQAALRLGAKDILLKPLDGKKLKNSIQRTMGFKFTSNDLVDKTLIYLDEHYGKDITLNQTAKDLFVTPHYLAHAFKKYTTKTFNKYLNELRIEKAKDLLLNSKCSIKDAAHQVGYANLNNFYSRFKSHTGMTPGAFLDSQK